MTTIGLIGAGHIGSQIARQAIAHGYDVVVSNSRGPETLADLVAELGDHARPATAAEAAGAADIAVVTIPFLAIDKVPVEPLNGKAVIDTNNYYWERDGHIAELDDLSETSSAKLQQHLPDAHVVKAFNHIFASAITDEAQDAGTPDRRALAIFGDDAAANATVAAFIDAIGFDTVDGGPLSESWRIQRDTPAYGPRLTAEELRKALASATK
ncbi:NAD(P)-binding domain-containing protein [Planctomonas sp. JC2975]|uniref:NADPH-dependent F420 reductase n=1 Tax=Planctomonas sp. JC2975 TaxID=2729626 RepID=UPI001474038C|nr:NAD(P)-binding domain-containing protein [Planctomonas sp. JC2975]NNC13165.1 NAD(P)-binding domain-containing protein [Planctomonas sp. JC2975]